MDNFKFLVVCLAVCCVFLGFVLGWTAKWFYDKYVKESEEECDNFEEEYDE